MGVANADGGQAAQTRAGLVEDTALTKHSISPWR